MRLWACEDFTTPAEVVADECACDLDLVADAALIAEVIDQASDILTVLSDRRVTGICTVTVRPFGDSYCVPRGFWASVSGGSNNNYFGVNVIPLRGPRTDIVEILVDGVALMASEYGLLDNRYLFRKSGSFPGTQDLTKDLTEVGTFGIEYRFGNPIDFVSRQAAIELGCELAKEYMGKPSRLPQGTTSANIQGVATTIADQDDDERREGLPRVSRFINLYAPVTRERNGVWSPDLAMGWDLVESEGPSGS